MKRAIVIGVTVFALALLAYTQRDRFTPVGVGSKAPMFAQKDRVVLVNFWATWCIPCRKEMPSLERLNQRLGSKGLVIMGVSVDEKESDAREYMAALGLTFRSVHDSDKSVEKLFQVEGLPTTFIIDKSGKIVEKVLGGRVWDDSARLRQLEGLIGPGT